MDEVVLTVIVGATLNVDHTYEQLLQSEADADKFTDPPSQKVVRPELVIAAVGLLTPVTINGEEVPPQLPAVTSTV
jgi:hypothetical protein